MRVEISPDGLQVEFHLPDGRHIPMVPASPVLPADPFRSLEASHRDRGVDPDPWTPTPGWFGEPLDYGLALEMLRAPQ
jgi:hypothetical protein